MTSSTALAPQRTATATAPQRTAIRVPHSIPQAAAAPGNSLGFALFLLVNAALFVRPSDVLPSLEGLEVYRYLLIGCLAVSAPAVLTYLGKGRLDTRPIDVCVYLLFPIVFLSGMAAGGFEFACEFGVAFFKIVVYYLLLVSLVTTPRRIHIFTGWMILFACAVTILSALDFYKVIEIPRLLLETGKFAYIDPDRMYGPGIFQDPNDICVLIVTCLIVLLGRLTDRRSGSVRWLWLVPLAVLVFGFVLTRSRGGMLSLLAGCAIAVRVRYGWGRVILLGVLGLPLLAASGSRQLEITSSTGSGQERIQLWNEGLVMFRANPVFGVGPDGYRENAGHVAHNSYIQAFGETGFTGGALFLGSVVLAVLGMYRLCRPVALASGITIPHIEDPDLYQLYPFLTGAVTAYAAGMMTLTLNNLVTTYAFLGLASIFMSMTITRPSVAGDRFSPGLLFKLICLGALFLVAIFVFIRLTFQG